MIRVPWKGLSFDWCRGEAANTHVCKTHAILADVSKACGTCGLEKDASDFHREAKRKDGLASQCKSCRSDHYKKTYPAKSIHIRETVKNRQRLIAEEIIKLKTRPCMDCGRSFPPCAMDFDHRGASDKEADIARLVSSGASLATIEAEVVKCDLVCSNCHRIRTQRRNMHKYGAVPEWLTGLPAKQFFTSSILVCASKKYYPELLDWNTWIAVQGQLHLKAMHVQSEVEYR